MNLEKTNSYINSKIYTILGLLFVFSIALFFVYGITIEREGRLNQVTQEIKEKYAEQQIISGPTLTSLFGTTIYPETLEITVDSKHDTKSRGIFEVPIYTAEITMEGSFEENYLDSFSKLEINGNDIKNISNIKNSKNQNPFEVETYNRGRDFKLIQNLNNDTTDFKITFDIIGTKSLQFLPNGNTNIININSDWKHPSFVGGYLPSTYELNQNGFTSNWTLSKINNFKKDFDEIYDIESSAIGYNMFQPNNIYAKTVKSIKYGIFVIALVFFSFFIVEIFSKKKVNNLQYILIGLSLVIYYSLLLSLGEIIGFTIAYILASAATILLNTGFTTLILKKAKYGLSISIILTSIYVVIFAILQTSQYTLLIGSISSYLIVAISMLSTYFIDFEEIKNNLK